MKSIQAKVVALLLFFVLIASFGVGTVCVMQTSRILHDNAQDNMKLLCEKSAQELDTMFGKVEESVDTLAKHVVDNLGTIQALKNPDYLVSYIETIEAIGTNHASSIRGIHSVYVALAPELAGPSQGFFWVRDPQSGLLAKNSITDVTAFEDSDASHVTWYYTPKKAGRATWIDAYQNDNVGVRMFTYVVPVYKNETFFGVVGMDISCDVVEGMLRDLSIYETGYAAVLNKDKTIMYHPTLPPGIKVNQLDSFSSEEHYTEIRDSMSENASSAVLFTYELEGEERMFSFYRLRNGMFLCVSAPTSEIFQKQNSLITVSIATAALIALLCIVAAVLFARRLTRPLKSLTSAAYQMIKGNLDAPIESTTKDEIGKLAFSLNKAREQLKMHIDNLYDEAFRDGLTGISNKSAYVEQERILNKRIKEGRASFVIALLDVNRLKITNDLFGHMAGDEMLRLVAGHLRTDFEAKNVFRTGGDEFVVLLQGNNPKRDAERIVTSTYEMQKLHLADYEDIHISCSIGVAIFDPKTDKTLSDTLARADKMMYKHKAYTKRNAPAWQEGSKGLRQLQIEKHLEFLRILAQSTEDYLFLLDIENDKNYFIGNISERYDIPKAGSETNTVQELLSITHESDREALSADLQRVIEGNSGEHNMDYRWVDRSGNAVWINCRGRVIRDDAGNPFLMIGRVSDTLLTSYYNPITGLFNKQRLTQDLQEHRTPDFTHFMLLDVDNLSDINLNRGRSTGDELLRTLSRTLEGIFPMSRLYHVEKDRFAILLDTGAERKIRGYFERINKQLGAHATVSAAVVPNDGTVLLDENGLYEYAKHLLKVGKKESARKLSFFSKQDYLQKLSDIELVEEMEHAVSNHFEGFSLLYQPQIRAKDYAVIGAEALLRYESPTKGNVPPEQFIPLLERTKMINAVGFWVLESALKQCRAWRTMYKDFSIAVNFSMVQIRLPQIASRTAKLLQEQRLPGNALTIELTESVPLEDTDQLNETFNKFRQADIRISIDDFGTGYANFAHLKKIHADEIKIDRMFTQEIRQNNYNFNIVRNIVEIAKSNNLHICFEGVENVEDLLQLEKIGADLFQGYLFGKATTAEDFTKTFLDPALPAAWPFLQDMDWQKGRSQLRHIDAKDIMSKIGIGLWLLRYDHKLDTGELWIDETLQDLLGFPADLAPDLCFKYWRENLSEEMRAKLRVLVKEIEVNEKVFQFEIPWMHPQRGNLLARYTGKCVEREGDAFLLEGFHRIVHANDT